MSIIKWEPFSDMFRIMESFGPQTTGLVAPPVDVYRDGNNIVVEANMPNLNKDKLNVSIDDGALTIRAESDSKREIDEKNFYRHEVRHGSFFRAIPLPAEVKGDKAEAKYENGVLKVTVPLAEEAKSRQIKVDIK